METSSTVQTQSTPMVTNPMYDSTLSTEKNKRENPTKNKTDSELRANRTRRYKLTPRRDRSPSFPSSSTARLQTNPRGLATTDITPDLYFIITLAHRLGFVAAIFERLSTQARGCRPANQRSPTRSHSSSKLRCYQLNSRDLTDGDQLVHTVSDAAIIFAHTFFQRSAVHVRDVYAHRRDLRSP